MSTHRTHQPSSSPSPARLALSLSDPGSSGLINVADLRAEPLPLSLVSAGLTSTPPPPAPTPPRRRPWPMVVVGSAVGLTVALFGMVATLQPSPTVVVERPATIDRQLSMQEIEAPELLDTVEHDADETPPAEIIAMAEADANEETEVAAVTKPKPTSKTRKTRRRSSTAKARSKTSRSASSTTPSPKSDSIPIECVLDPAGCSSTGKPKAKPSAGSGNTGSTEALPAKLSTTQLKQALARTKADARRCGPEHGADSGTKVTVKLSIEGKTGTVKSSTAQGDHASSSLGRCVAGALGRTKFPRFTAGRMGTMYSVRL